MAIVTLTTDFGLDDSYVGQVRGALLEIAPALVCVDLCHGVPAHDVAAGAWLLESGYGAFPRGTIHLAVVDPGVGTDRGALVARTERYDFVAPDNGLLTRVLDRERVVAVHRVDAGGVRRPGGATTFDGRDLFAPAAARLACGESPAALGPRVEGWIRLPRLRAEPIRGTSVDVGIVHVDRFGNVTLDVEAQALARARGRRLEPGEPALRVECGGRVVEELRADYAGGDATPFLIVGSSGYLEISVQTGRADAALGLRRGNRVALTVL